MDDRSGNVLGGLVDVETVAVWSENCTREEVIGVDEQTDFLAAIAEGAELHQDEEEQEEQEEMRWWMGPAESCGLLSMGESSGMLVDARHGYRGYGSSPPLDGGGLRFADTN